MHCVAGQLCFYFYCNAYYTQQYISKWKAKQCEIQLCLHNPYHTHIDLTRFVMSSWYHRKGGGGLVCKLCYKNMYRNSKHLKLFLKFSKCVKTSSVLMIVFMTVHGHGICCWQVT
jgi:hypothetical protein